MTATIALIITIGIILLLLLAVPAAYGCGLECRWIKGMPLAMAYTAAVSVALLGALVAGTVWLTVGHKEVVLQPEEPYHTMLDREARAKTFMEAKSGTQLQMWVSYDSDANVGAEGSAFGFMELDRVYDRHGYTIIMRKVLTSNSNARHN